MIYNWVPPTAPALAAASIFPTIVGHPMSFRGTIILCLASALPFISSMPSLANPALEGYANHAALTERVQKLDASEVARVTSLGKTLEERDIWLITLGTGEVDTKPAILIVGNVVAEHVVGAEVALRMAEQLVAQAADNEQIKSLLTKQTIYILPSPTPDATEKSFVKPYAAPQGNLRKTDDDRDGTSGEDPTEDLNEDGWITMLRIEDVRGEYIPHPDDERVMIKAEVAKQERGRYRLLTEGIDNDHDDAFNEDGAGGVDFNRNFTFDYPTFQPHAGPHQVSEQETRAIADFCFGHPNIAIVWAMTPEDNFLQPWKADAGKEKVRIKSTIFTSDATYHEVLAELYKKIVEPKDAPESKPTPGSFLQWSYFHYGRMAWGTRLWWVPKIEAPPADEAAKEETKEDAKPDDEKPAEAKKPSDEKRSADDIRALRYFAAKDIDGFVPWTPIEHPDFPGQKVEVGGFKPFYRLNPPAAELDGFVEKQLTFLTQAAAKWPQLSVTNVKTESLGGGVVRLSLTVVNEGFLPTMTEMGEVGQQMYPLWLEWTVPEKTVWIQGFPRTRLKRLAGAGGTSELTWLVRLPEAAGEAELKFRVGAPSVHAVEATVPVPAATSK